MSRQDDADANDSDAGAGAGTEMETDADAATVLADDDDRTQLVTRPPETPRSDSSPSDPPPSDPPGAEPLQSEAATRVVETRLIEESPEAEPPATRAASRRRPPVDPDRGLVPGTVLFGEYEIVSVLGVGGMGEVYRARHRRLEEHRAIKVMHAELSNKKGASEFFYREAKALLAVRHPAVVHCHDLLSDEEGRVYLIMEMIEGVALSKKMNDGPLSPDDVAILGARVAHGLSAAHRKGVIHRDVSPDNIVLPNGRVQEAKVIDFGIAKILQEGEGTIIDGFKGKLSYASPEQLGFFGGKIDGRSDFYSLGLVLTAAALGRPLGMGTTVMEAVDARRGFDALPEEVPASLRSAIQPLLALDPKDRPRHVDRLFVVPGGVAALTDPGGYGSGGDVSVNHAGSGASRGSFRGGRLAGLVASVMLLLAGGAYWALTPGSVSPPAPARSPVAESTDFTGSASGIASVDDPGVLEAGSEQDAGAGLAPQPARTESAPPTSPAPRRITARDRIRIIGLLSNASIALSENRLMSPPGDNAYDRYRSVLELDPENAKARAGLRDVAARYLSLSDSAAGRDEIEQARLYLQRAREADAGHPGLAAASRRIAAGEDSEPR